MRTIFVIVSRRQRAVLPLILYDFGSTFYSGVPVLDPRWSSDLPSSECEVSYETCSSAFTGSLEDLRYPGRTGTTGRVGMDTVPYRQTGID